MSKEWNFISAVVYVKDDNKKNDTIDDLKKLVREG